MIPNRVWRHLKELRAGRHLKELRVQVPYFTKNREDYCFKSGLQGGKEEGSLAASLPRTHRPASDPAPRASVSTCLDLGVEAGGSEQQASPFQVRQRKFKALEGEAAGQRASGPVHARRGHGRALGKALAVTAQEAL